MYLVFHNLIYVPSVDILLDQEFKNVPIATAIYRVQVIHKITNL